VIQKTIHLGPIHPGLPGAMKLSLDLCGDQVVSSQAEFGYLSKHVEELMKNKNIIEAQRFFSRLEPESAFLLDRIFSEAIEKSIELTLSARATWIRDVTTLISELNGFLKYLALMASRLGVQPLEHILLKHREELLDLIELLTGSRYGYYYLQPGGARYDITDGFVERLEIWIKNYKADFARIEALYLWTHPFHNRLKSLGRVVDDGKLGFVSRASVETTQFGLVSHVESRLLYALKQTIEISDDLHDLVGERHLGAFQAQSLNEMKDHRPKHQSVSAEVTTGRGTWHLNLKLTKGLLVESLDITSPSHEISQAISPALEDEQFEDVPLILQSLNFLVSEIDR
jgi:NADH:ubiquinone oxidoreductase subunit D